MSPKYDLDDLQQQEYAASRAGYLISAFDEGLDCICAQKEIVRDFISVAAGDSRVIFGATQNYVDLIRRSVHPALLASSAKRAAYIRAQRAKSTLGSGLEPVRASEENMLIQGMVPYFLESEVLELVPKSFSAGRTVARQRLARLESLDYRRRLREELEQTTAGYVYPGAVRGHFAMPSCLI